MTDRADGRVREVAVGLGFTEGPVVLPDGDIVIVADGAVRRVTRSGEVSMYADPGGGPNGLALGPDGELYIANNGGAGPGRIERVIAGRIDVVADELDAPNDVVVGPDGALWFTDPRDGYYDDALRPGRVYRCTQRGDDLTIVHEGFTYPNGLGFDLDGSLVVAETKTGTLHRVGVGGTASPWVRLPGSPDGLCFAADGRAFVCCFDVGQVYVLDAAGEVIDAHTTGPETWPTNCTLAADGTLFVTEGRGGRLLAIDDA